MYQNEASITEYAKSKVSDEPGQPALLMSPSQYATPQMDQVKIPHHTYPFQLAQAFISQRYN